VLQRSTDLQEHAIKVDQKEIPVEQNMTDYERSLWERAAAKYPVETRTPDQQKKLERTVARMVREHEGQEIARQVAGQTVQRSPAPPPPDYHQKPERGMSRGM
jgi:LysM repeat protein